MKNYSHCEGAPQVRGKLRDCINLKDSKGITPNNPQRQVVILRIPAETLREWYEWHDCYRRDCFPRVLGVALTLHSSNLF